MLFALLCSTALVLVENRGMRVPPVSREMHCRRRVECTSGAKLHCTMQWEDAQWGDALLKGWGVSVVLVHLGRRCITQWEDALRGNMQWWDALHVTVRDTFEGREKIPMACDENHFEVGSILYLNLREWVELTKVWLADSGKLTLSKTTKNIPTCQVNCCIDMECTLSKIGSDPPQLDSRDAHLRCFETDWGGWLGGWVIGWVGG